MRACERDCVVCVFALIRCSHSKWDSIYKIHLMYPASGSAVTLTPRVDRGRRRFQQSSRWLNEDLSLWCPYENMWAYIHFTVNDLHWRVWREYCLGCLMHSTYRWR